jgi:hypothetical protein
MDFSNVSPDILDRIVKISICENFKLDEDIQPSDVYIEKRLGYKGATSKYAVTYQQNCMNHEGDFTFEPMPSSRDEKFLKEFRFSSLVEAYEAFTKHFQKRPN